MAEDVCIFSANAIRAQVILHALQQAGISAVLSANKPMNYKLSIYGTPPPRASRGGKHQWLYPHGLTRDCDH
ncbi:MAG: hypothetical protein SFH39_03195 [Candidatus Magnetobacterium sp. LHC-1]